jgi:hypothetical protein
LELPTIDCLSELLLLEAALGGGGKSIELLRDGAIAAGFALGAGLGLRMDGKSEALLRDGAVALPFKIFFA